MKAVSFLLILLNELKLECVIRFWKDLPVKYTIWLRKFSWEFQAARVLGDFWCGQVDKQD